MKSHFDRLLDDLPTALARADAIGSPDPESECALSEAQLPGFLRLHSGPSTAP